MFEKIVLASASPRRRELLKAAGFEHEVIVANIEEKRRQGERPEDYVQRNAKEKALAVCSTQPVAVAKAIVLAADTLVVAFDNEVPDFKGELYFDDLISVNQGDHIRFRLYWSTTIYRFQIGRFDICTSYNITGSV